MTGIIIRFHFTAALYNAIRGGRNMTDIEIFSKRVKELRLSKGMTPTEFARKTGVQEKEIRMIEGGEAGEIRLSEAKKIAKFAGVHVSELFLRYS